MSNKSNNIDDIYNERELAKDLERKKRQKQRRIKVYIYRILIVVIILAGVILVGKKISDNKKETQIKAEQQAEKKAKEKAEKEAAKKAEAEKEAAEKALEDEAEKAAEKLDLSSLPEDLVAALEFNSELEEFARGYAEKKDKTFDIDLSKEAESEEIPLLLQWDERWGYKQYAGEMFGLSGCGPATLSMICINKFHDPKYTPEYMGQFSTENGYVMDGKGSFWTLIGEGGEKLGLDVMELNPRKEDILWYLQEGNPVVCIMGPGEFTRTGHFIILTKYVDGKIEIRDSASVEKSNKLWTYEELGDQIQNAWVIK